MAGSFKFEDCLLKHFIRCEVWLPFCKSQLKELQKVFPKARRKFKTLRRLKYFTFCAAGALDVIMLEREGVIKRSDRSFDTVYFFDRKPSDIIETNKRVPGANGFAGDFVETLLMEDADEETVVDDQDSLESPEDNLDTSATREMQRNLTIRRDFIRSFPFDVINLDLEDYLFKPSEQLPGKLMKTMRKVFQWQRRSLRVGDLDYGQIESFTLLYTTRIGPHNLGDDYLDVLKHYITSNLNDIEALKAPYDARFGGLDAENLAKTNFEEFFKLAAPKAIVSLLKDEDWKVDPENGIRIFEFTRNQSDPPYKMLHLAMEVRRIRPSIDERLPGVPYPTIKAYYTSVVSKLFLERPVVVEAALTTVLKENLTNDLIAVKDHRKKFYPEG